MVNIKHLNNRSIFHLTFEFIPNGEKKFAWQPDLIDKNSEAALWVHNEGKEQIITIRVADPEFNPAATARIGDPVLLSAIFNPLSAEQYSNNDDMGPLDEATVAEILYTRE